MYSLLRFGDIYHVNRTKNVVRREDGYIGRYKNKGFFKADLLYTSDSRATIEDLKKNLESGFPKVYITSCSTVSTRKKFATPEEQNQPVKGTSKRYFCIYCKIKVTKFARHLERRHKDEEFVKGFTSLPKGCEERNTIIGTLRKQGNFLYNTDKNYNEGDMLVCRRKKLSSGEYKVCPNCKDFFSKITLRRHYLKCKNSVKKGDRTLMILSRKIRGDIHPKANEVLRKEVFPVLREDEITRLLRYDELLILYGNKLCEKYKAKYHQKMIRAKLRLMGRLLFELRKIDSTVGDFASIYNPELYDNFVRAVNILGELSDDATKYNKPALPSTVGTTVKHIGKKLITECIKRKDEERKKYAGQFLELLLEDYGTSVNKTVLETQAETSRQKKILLPTQDDITTLNQYVFTNMISTYKNLLKKFSYEHWKNLASFTLISIQLFNRRRAGEIERCKISDFEAYQSVENDENNDIQNIYSQNDKEAAKNYIRFCIRGKLNRTVPVLVNKNQFKCLESIISNRGKAGINPKNPYIFALPSDDNSHKYLSACNLLRKYSLACGAKHPNRLRGTELRKHLATRSAVLEYDKSEVSELASFLGHEEAVHRTHYRLSLPTRQIIKTTRILEDALGDTVTDHDGLSSLNTSENHNCQKISQSSDNNNSNQDSVYNSFNTSENSLCQKEARTDSKEDSIYSEYEPDSDCSDSPSVIHRVSSGVIRRSWNPNEISLAKKFFGGFIENGKLPSLGQCADVIAKNEDLRSRTPEQLKAWVNNEIKRKIRIKEQGEMQCRLDTKRRKIREEVRCKLRFS